MLSHCRNQGYGQFDRGPIVLGLRFLLLELRTQMAVGVECLLEDQWKYYSLCSQFGGSLTLSSESKKDRRNPLYRWCSSVRSQRINGWRGMHSPSWSSCQRMLMVWWGSASLLLGFFMMSGFSVTYQCRWKVTPAQWTLSQTGAVDSIPNRINYVNFFSLSPGEEVCGNRRFWHRGVWLMDWRVKKLNKWSCRHLRQVQWWRFVRSDGFLIEGVMVWTPGPTRKAKKWVYFYPFYLFCSLHPTFHCRRG